MVIVDASHPSISALWGTNLSCLGFDTALAALCLFSCLSLEGIAANKRRGGVCLCSFGVITAV